MPTTRLLPYAIVLLATITVSTGCQSTRSRMAWMNPWSKSGADATTLASSAPQLPSTKATPPGGATSVASTTPGANTTAPTFGGGTTAPAFGAASNSTIASAPAAAYPTTASASPSPASTAPAYNGSAAPFASAAATPPTATNVAAAPTAGAAGPYNPSGYKPAESTPPAVATNRYGGAGSRYGDAASASLPSMPTTNPLASAAAAPTPPSTTTATPSLGGRYGAPAAPATASAPPAGAGSRYPSYPTTAPTTVPTAVASTTPATTPATTKSLAAPPANSNQFASGAYPATSAPVAPASAEVKIDGPAGSYRPGGTSTYPVNVATRPASPTQPSVPAASPYPATPTTPSYPSTSPAYR